MKRKPSQLPSLACALTLILAAGPATIASAETIFSQDFETGLGSNETVSGGFSINDTLATLNNGTMMMGHAVAYGPLGGGVTPQPSYSYYDLVLDLRGHADAELRFDFSGAIEANFDGFNLLATTEQLISPPAGLIMPAVTSGFQYDAIPLTQHAQSSPELGATAWSSPTGSSVVKDLAAVFDLSAFEGEKVIVRFQFGTDTLEGGEGANFDNIVVEATPLPDSDSDGMSDLWEDAHGLNKNLDDRTLDRDRDGVDNITEYNNCTHPNNPDTDGDGLSDKVETKTGIFAGATNTGSDPRIADTDGDTLEDGTEVNTHGSDPNKTDTDGDGFDDKQEIDLGSDPANPLDKPKVWVIERLGTGTGALIGGDLTDPEDDGIEGTVPGNGDWSSLNWNWVSIQASSENYFGNFGGSEGSYDVFDNTVGPAQAKWCCDGPPQWITVEFEKPISLESFTITSGNDTPARDPLAWTISGSNNGIDFDLIFEQDDTTALWTERLEVLHFISPRRQKPYKFLKYEVTRTQNLHQINEIEYFGSSTVPRIPLEIGSDGADLTFGWESRAGMLYNLRTSDDLASDPSTWDVVEVGGVLDIPATPPGNMHAIVRPGDPVRYYRLEEFPAPPVLLFATDFEADDGGFTVVDHSGGSGTAWVYGDPNSTGEGGTVDTGNNGSTNCWGTNLGNPGFYATGTDTSLISPVIDLTGVAGATLSFAQAIDILDGDTLVINIIDDTTDTVIVPAIHTSTPDDDINTADWDTADGIAIGGAALGQPVRIEWRFTGANDGTYIGAYIDDVVVTEP
jgi:hypothetical protein